MGNTHSEAPAQRERELPLQTVEVLRKDRDDEKPSRRSNLSSKEEQQRVAASMAFRPSSLTDPQPDRGPQGAATAISDPRVKPNQGKKRKIAKARKWTPGQAMPQEAVDKPMSERLHSSIRVYSPGPGEGRAA
eukprot:g20119.t1